MIPGSGRPVVDPATTALSPTPRLFNPTIQSDLFLDNHDAAVQVNGKWKFYDVSDEYAPLGTLTWREQGVYALMPDSKESEWVTTPLLSSTDSQVQRIANITLSPEGDVDGDIREIFWGNEGIGWRMRHAHQNDSERETYIRDRLKERYADFEVSNIKVTISPDASRPGGGFISPEREGLLSAHRQAAVSTAQLLHGWAAGVLQRC